MKNECNLVQDLLPNYIEKLTNEKTNMFIEKQYAETRDAKALFH